MQFLRDNFSPAVSPNSISLFHGYFLQMCCRWTKQIICQKLVSKTQNVSRPLASILQDHFLNISFSLIATQKFNQKCAGLRGLLVYFIYLLCSRMAYNN